MPRSNSSEYRYNNVGQDTWTSLEEELYLEELRSTERYAPASTCRICGRDRRAEKCCPACGDVEEMAA